MPSTERDSMSWLISDVRAPSSGASPPHGDGVGELAERELDVERHDRARRQRQSLPPVSLKSGQLGLDHVWPDRQRSECVEALSVGRCTMALAGLTVDGGHRDARQRTFGGIGDGTADRRFRRLRIRHRRDQCRCDARNPQQRYDGKSRAHEHLTRTAI